MIQRLLLTLTLLLTCSATRAQQQNFPSGSSGSSSPAAPVMAFYLSPACVAGSIGANGQCYNTFADTQEANACSWTNASTTVTCLAQVIAVTGSVTANVATYSFYTVIPSNWVSGDSITIAGFTGGDTYLNQTCTISAILSAISGSTITCPLVHANASSTTFGSIVNNARGPFVAGDVGKSVMGGNTCVADSTQANMGAEISTTTTPTITAFISSTQVTISATPSNTATLHVTFPSGACFIWGHLDDAAAVTVDLAMQNSGPCPKLFMAASSYFFASPHFYNNPPGCAQVSPGVFGANSGGLGNTTLPAGMEIEGRGAGNTAWYIAPSFPSGDSCAHKPAPIVAPTPGSGCFVLPVMSKWTDFRIDGGAQTTAPNLNGKTLVYASVAALNRITCDNLGPYNATMIGLGMNYLVQLDDYNNAGCGGIGMQNDASVSGSVAKRIVIENSATSALIMGSGSDLTCYWCDFALPAAGNNAKTIQNNGGTLKMFGGKVLPTNIGSSAGTGIILYTDTGSGTLSADSTLFDLLTFASNGGLFCSGAGCKMSLVNGARVNNPSSNFAYADSAGGTLYVDPSFSYTGTFSNGNIVGSVVADGHSLTGIGTGVCTASSTLGLRITGTSTAGAGIVSTCTSAALDAGVQMTAARTLSNLRCTSSATTVSVACTVLVNGSPSALTCTMTAATACNDFTHTVAVVLGDLVSERVVTGAAETGANIKAFVMWQ